MHAALTVYCAQMVRAMLLISISLQYIGWGKHEFSFFFGIEINLEGSVERLIVVVARANLNP